MKAFKAYDIRGIFNVDFNLNDVYRIGYYLPKLMKTDKILVGRDIRNSSPEIFENLCKGINDSGAAVFDAGLSTTPMIYYLTANEGFDASVMITASHNDKEYNGMKISGHKALPIGYDTGLAELEKMIQQKPEPVRNPGKIIPFNKKQKYLDFLKQYQKDYSGLRLAVDCSNGMAALFVEKLLGPSVKYLNLGMDGDFPGHAPNPLVEDNLKALIKTVKEKELDLGIIFDGDADRVMFVDEKGRFIRPDLMIALLGDYFLRDTPGAIALHDIRSSRAVSEHLNNAGAEVHMWRVGRAFAARKLKEIDGLFGGELAGHYYFRDFFYSDSGLMSALIVLNVLLELKNKGIQTSEYFDNINPYFNSGEINFKIEAKQEAMEQIKAHFMAKETPEQLHDFDGYRLDFKDWWFNIRPSNTEPYLRFIAEARSQKKLDTIISETSSIIKTMN